MRLHRLGTLLVVLVALDSGIRAQFTEPYSGATEPGVPFPLPQELASNGRLLSQGGSNALTFSWDGRLLMYADTGAVWGQPPAGAVAAGYVFAAFDPSKVKLENGRPNFAPTGQPPAIGAPFPRFAEVDVGTRPDSTGLNDYPTYDPNGFPSVPHYPYIAGTMGELGLQSYDVLSNNMYPAPTGELPSGAHGQNPYPSDANGNAAEFGAYRTYRAYVTFQDLPRFWNPHWHWNGTAWQGLWQGYTIPVGGGPGTFAFLGYYPPGQYPNGRSVDATHPAAEMKRNGIAQLEITTDPAANTVLRVAVLKKWKPFTLSTPGWTNQTAMAPYVGLGLPSTSTMYADNFEPILTHDGHLMVGKGSPYLVNGIGQTSRAVFYVNPTAFAETGWQGPYELTQLYSMRNTVLGPENLTIAERYPISRHPFKDYAGNVLTSADPFEGGYTWIDPDGRFLIYSTFRAGVADGLSAFNPNGYPETWLASDGGSGSNRAHASIVGSVTGWQMWRIDHEAENPNRHMFTAWDQQSRTTHLRVASLGFGPGFWNVLKGAEGLPLRDDGRLKLQLVNSNRLLYYELDLSPYQERDYGFYLPMTEMMVLLPPPSGFGPDFVRREVDVTRTPDLSGNAHVGIVEGGQLPCEYFGLPTYTNDAPGLYDSVTSPSLIASGWTASDCITVGSGPNTRYWARLADWKDGRDSNMDVNHTIDTSPFLGRGDVRDMDSDACWGRVGEAMFFRNATRVRVSNAGFPSELNPGTDGNARGLTASFWINPRQARTADTAVFQHNFTISLKQNGEIAATVGPLTISSGSRIAAVEQWTHVALTWRDTPTASSSDLTLFLNGTQVAKTTIARDSLLPSTADILVGCLTTCAVASSRAVLLLDEVALKNSALVGQDVVDLALGPVPTKTWDNANLPAGPYPFVDATDARVPTSSPYDAAIANLGADLFRDVQLSGSKDLSCASCHDPANAFVDGLEHPTGNIRNTQTIYNQRYQVEQLWDHRANDLEDQVGFPLASTTEMNKSMAAVLTYLSGDADYAARFHSAPFAVPGVSEPNFRQAIATYERAVTAGKAPADRYDSTDPSALTTKQKLGRALFFGKARCSGCHAGPNFTDGRLWTTGDFRADGFDNGAFGNHVSSPSSPTPSERTAGRARFLGAFKTPSLRELGRTDPYFHDGRASSLAEVIEFYDAGGVRTDPVHPGWPLLDDRHDIVAEEINRRLGLTDKEKLDLEDYLLALTTDGSSAVNDGPTGSNHVPTVTNVTASYDVSTGTVTVSAMARDRLDNPDMDSSMSWTLDVEWPGGTRYHWADASSITPVTWGYAVTVAKPGPSSGQVRVRAADHHGLWSGWTTVNY